MHELFRSGNIVDVLFVFVILCHIMEVVFLLELVLVFGIGYLIFDWKIIDVRIYVQY